MANQLAVHPKTRMNAFVTLPTIGVFIALVLYRLWDSFRRGL